MKLRRLPPISYWLSAFILGTVFLFLALLLSNLQFVSYVWSSDLYGWEQKLKITNTLLASLGTNFSAIDRYLLIVVSYLAGVNMTLGWYYLRQTVAMKKAAGASVLGIILGVLGAGCSACGSVVLSGMIGLGAATSFLSILPWGGQEFSWLSLVLLLGSTGYIIYRLEHPITCKTKK